MAILTTIGITLLCLGYLVLIFVSLSSKPEQDEKNSESIPNNRPFALHQSKTHPSSLSKTGTPG
jgi:hypothetical protein